MIDWVSIVRHSHRRFSNYMYAVPNKVRKRRQKFIKRQNQSAGSAGNVVPHGSNCSCCWAGDKVQVIRFPTHLTTLNCCLLQNNAIYVKSLLRSYPSETYQNAIIFVKTLPMILYIKSLQTQYDFRCYGFIF